MGEGLETTYTVKGKNLVRVCVWFRSMTLGGRKVNWSDILEIQIKRLWLADFPGSSNDKESACNEGDLSSIPGLGRGSRKESDTPEQLTLFADQLCVGWRWVEVRESEKNQMILRFLTSEPEREWLWLWACPVCGCWASQIEIPHWQMKGKTGAQNQVRVEDVDFGDHYFISIDAMGMGEITEEAHRKGKERGKDTV